MRKISIFVILLSGSAIFALANPANAQRNTTCATSGGGRNCTNEQPSGQTWYYCGGTCRLLPADPGAPFSLNCASCVWQCPSGTTLCGSTNTCVTNLACPSGTTFDACSNSCSTPYILRNQLTPQADTYLKITGNLESTSGDLYLANTKAIRIDATGASVLNLGNYTAAGTDFNLTLHGKLETSLTLQNVDPVYGTDKDRWRLRLDNAANDFQIMRVRWPSEVTRMEDMVAWFDYTTGGLGSSYSITTKSILPQGGGAQILLLGDIDDTIRVSNNLRVDGSAVLGAATPAATALLDLTSTTKGLLPPRMTTAQRNGVVSPAAGLTIYNTSTNELNVYKGASGWQAVGAAAAETDPIYTAWYTGGNPTLQSLSISNLTVTGTTTTPTLCLGVNCRGSWLSAGKYLTINAGTNTISAVDSAGCFGPKFTGLTTSAGVGGVVPSTGSFASGRTNGDIAFNSVQQYRAANSACAAAHPGSHLCTTAEILNSINCESSTVLNSALEESWISNGAPALPAQTNDCQGWNYGVLSASFNGVAWAFGTDGGAGWARACSEIKPLACCQ
ncbi:hypothetical protein A2753_03765 [Candidatus Uhrbacteria bacterium RIFCSPHIGHO2_01_FULL_47_11]|nr:MAG: hypothetical protein A2753_03765 [Candidatus Uhrbacteria bacterium RIFCSPHIGHO2_01_FULL_47_11]